MRAYVQKNVFVCVSLDAGVRVRTEVEEYKGTKSRQSQARVEHLSYQTGSTGRNFAKEGDERVRIATTSATTSVRRQIIHASADEPNVAIADRRFSHSNHPDDVRRWQRAFAKTHR